MTAGLALVLMQAFFTVPVFERRSTRNAAVAARAAQAQGRTLTQEQRDAIRDWDRIYNASLPPREEVQKEIDDYRGGYGWDTLVERYDANKDAMLAVTEMPREEGIHLRWEVAKDAPHLSGPRVMAIADMGNKDGAVTKAEWGHGALAFLAQ